MFYIDSVDVVGFMCLCEVKEGGDLFLVSVESIYNRMCVECLDLLELFFDFIVIDWCGEVFDGMDFFMIILLLNWYDGKLIVFY